jgi:uncharacterized membrane protein YfcA
MDFFTDMGAFVGGYTAFQFAANYLKMTFGLVLILASFFIIRMQKRKIDTTLNLKNGFGYWQRSFGDERYTLFLPVVFRYFQVILDSSTSEFSFLFNSLSLS